MSSTIEILNGLGERAVGFAWPMLWQSSLLIGLLFLLDFLLRRKLRAAVLYVLWLTVLVKLLLPPSLALPSGVGWWLRPAKPSLAVQNRVRLVVTYGHVSAPNFPSQNLPVLSSPQHPPVSPGAWVLVASSWTSLGLLGWMLARWKQAARITRQAVPPPDWLDQLLQETRGAAGLLPSVRLRLVDRAVSPAVCGLFHPIILLPRTLVEQLTARQMRAILLYEVIHLRRGDVWINCIQAVLQVVYWWHPLLWLANARIRRARQEAVDDAVMLALRSDGDAYPPTLIQVARLVLHHPLTSLSLVGILESSGSLRRRIERLIDFPPPRKAGLTLASALGLAAFGALALPMGQAPVRSHESETPSAPASPAAASLAPASPPAASMEPASPASEGPKAKREALVQNARRLFEMGKLDEAEKTLKEVVAQDPANRAHLDTATIMAG